MLNKCFTKYVTSLLNFLTAIKISKKFVSQEKCALWSPWIVLIEFDLGKKNAAKSLNLELSHLIMSQVDLNLREHFQNLDKHTKLTFVGKSDENSLRFEEIFQVKNC